MQPLLDVATEACQWLWDMGVYMTIDESMILRKSRFVNGKQCMPLKPIKHGIKVFALACGETGYICNFSVYQGKGTGNIMETVLNTILTGDLVGSGRICRHILFTDNCYTTVVLGVVLRRSTGSASWALFRRGKAPPRAARRRRSRSGSRSRR